MAIVPVAPLAPHPTAAPIADPAAMRRGHPDPAAADNARKRVPATVAARRAIRGIADTQSRARGPRHDGPRFEGPRHDAPRRDGPHSDGPRSDGPRSDGPRSDGPRPEAP